MRRQVVRRCTMGASAGYGQSAIGAVGVLRRPAAPLGTKNPAGKAGCGNQREAILRGPGALGSDPLPNGGPIYRVSYNV